MDNMQKLDAKQLRMLRIKRGWSQRRLAEMATIARSRYTKPGDPQPPTITAAAIHGYEKGGNLTVATLGFVADALGVKAGDLIKTSSD